MQLELSDDERQLLERILSAYLGDLRMEVAATDNAEFKHGLRDEELVIRRFLDALRAS